MLVMGVAPSIWLSTLEKTAPPALRKVTFMHVTSADIDLQGEAQR